MAPCQRPVLEVGPELLHALLPPASSGSWAKPEMQARTSGSRYASGRFQ